MPTSCSQRLATRQTDQPSSLDCTEGNGCQPVDRGAAASEGGARCNCCREPETTSRDSGEHAMSRTALFIRQLAYCTFICNLSPLSTSFPRAEPCPMKHVAAFQSSAGFYLKNAVPFCWCNMLQEVMPSIRAKHGSSMTNCTDLQWFLVRVSSTCEVLAETEVNLVTSRSAHARVSAETRRAPASAPLQPHQNYPPLSPMPGDAQPLVKLSLPLVRSLANLPIHAC